MISYVSSYDIYYIIRGMYFNIDEWLMDTVFDSTSYPTHIIDMVYNDTSICNGAIVGRWYIFYNISI